MSPATALRAGLPLAALAALALPSLIRTPPAPVAAVVAPAAPVALTAEGRGAVTTLDGKIVTDGSPQPVVLRLAAPQRPAARPARHDAAARPRTLQAVRAHVARVHDGYPWATDASWGADPWGFTKRQCVSYVAWRLAGAGSPLDNATQNWGSALTWDDTARRLGYPVGSRPFVGAVAQWNANERGAYWSPGADSPDGAYVAGPAGHVAWVVDVYDDGSVLVAQYNGTGNRAFSTMRVKAPRYLSL